MRTVWMPEDTLARKEEFIKEFRLIPGGHGKFDIRINQELVAEHRHEPNAHIIPDLQDLLQAIDERP